MKTPDEIKKDALALIQQTHASYRQLSKVLCGKENATLEEVLQAVDQVKQNKPGKKLICEITVGSEDIRKVLELMEMDGKTIIERIEPEKGCEQLEQELADIKRERDVAVSIVKDCCGCEKCDHYTGTEEHIESICLDCEDKCHFEMFGMKGFPVTPEQFLAKVESFYDNGRDPEVFHDKTDALMEDILIAFGYQKGIEFLRSKVRWYA